MKDTAVREEKKKEGQLENKPRRHFQNSITKNKGSSTDIFRAPETNKQIFPPLVNCLFNFRQSTGEYVFHENSSNKKTFSGQCYQKRARVKSVKTLLTLYILAFCDFVKPRTKL